MLVFGLGYTGTAIAGAAQAAEFTVAGTSRDPGERRAPAGIRLLPFDAAAPEVARATHVLATIPVGEGGDLVLDRYGPALAASEALRWAGYLSTTGVYGDRNGEWVDEETEPRPASPRTRRRRAAELAWSDLPCAVDLFRVAGIYGPGRSPFEALRAGTAHRIIKPGHQFGRIHRDDIAAAVLAAMVSAQPGAKRVFNLSDDEPAEAATVTEEAARLLGIAPPPATPFADAVPGMSAMGRSFWSENRKVDSRKTQARLGLRWRYPTYREGLRAILAAEGCEQRGEGPGQQA
ncbi:MAG: SDR family NAD(P)-dependent oxidoreductase [Acetobacteraceae bacterium]|nr:SDR family NAD(P)-dependent oxidoreductase [Acetobacteraceae bacterium]